MACQSIRCSSWVVPSKDVNSPRSDLRDGVGAVVEGVVAFGLVVAFAAVVVGWFLGVLPVLCWRFFASDSSVH